MMCISLILIILLLKPTTGQWGSAGAIQQAPSFGAGGFGSPQLQGGGFGQPGGFGNYQGSLGPQPTQFPAQQQQQQQYQNTFPLSQLNPFAGQIPSNNPQMFSNQQMFNPSYGNMGAGSPVAYGERVYSPDQQPTSFGAQFNQDSAAVRGLRSTYSQSQGNSVTLASGTGSPPKTLFGPNGPQIPGAPEGLQSMNPSGSNSEVQRVIPPFLHGVDKETEDKFYSIVQHPQWTADEKQAKIEEFVRDLDTEKQNIYSAYQRQWEGQAKEKRDKVHIAVDSMSDEAKQQFQKVSALMTQPSMSDNERLQKIQAIYSKLSDSVRKEFDTKLASFGK